MDKCKKHDDQMAEWIMCLRTAKEVWDAAFLKDGKYEVNCYANLIYALAAELYHERVAMRKAVVDDERMSESIRKGKAVRERARKAMMGHE